MFLDCVEKCFVHVHFSVDKINIILSFWSILISVMQKQTRLSGILYKNLW